MKKVYCKDCKYHERLYTLAGVELYCSLANPKVTNEYTGEYESNYIIKEIENKTGECKYYKPSFMKNVKEFFRILFYKYKEE